MNKSKLICGVGTNDYEGATSIKGVRLRSYLIWKSMLERCYSSKAHIKYPTYRGCSVSEKWLSFSNFKLWYDANYRERYQIDKDIIVHGNKVYSADTCAFVPLEINYLILKADAIRGTYPIGVSLHKATAKFRAYVSNGNRHISLGYFHSIEDAKNAYIEAKSKHIIEVANKYIAEGLISDAVYGGLLRIANSMKNEVT